MTIAACYVSPEGIVLAADSASTYAFPAGHHHFNYGQKLFEIGADSTLGIVTWGLGGLALGSYRSLAARLGDSVKRTPVASVQDAALQWVDLVWPIYTGLPEVQHAQALEAKPPFNPAEAKPPFNPAAPTDPTRRSQFEEVQLGAYKDNLVVGFCIGGYVPADRDPAAFETIFDPVLAKPVPTQLPMAQSFWGVPAIIDRLIKGCGDDVRGSILSSGKWNGTPQELDALIAPHRLFHPATVPIREAIDFTHACLLATIKAMKFSLLPRFCGGPVELAVITTDRPFRWVQHKSFDSAIRESDP